MCTWWCIPKQAQNGLQGEEGVSAANEKNGGGGGSRGEARDSINEEKLEWKEMKVEPSWRGCSTRPFLLQAAAVPLRAPLNEASSNAGCSGTSCQWEEQKRWIKGRWRGGLILSESPVRAYTLTTGHLPQASWCFLIIHHNDRKETGQLICFSNVVYEQINREEVEEIMSSFFKVFEINDFLTSKASTIWKIAAMISPFLSLSPSQIVNDM